MQLNKDEVDLVPQGNINNLPHIYTSYFYSASAVDDLQMKELQDQLEAETYFSVKKCFETYRVFSYVYTAAILVP